MYKIREDKITELSDQLEKLQNRMSKLSDDCRVHLEIVDIETVTDDTGRVTCWYIVEVAGELPNTGDYQFVARLLPDMDNGENIIRTIPGHADDIPSRFRHSGNSCDHCRLNRNRKTTYVLRHVETAEYLQVGSTCVNDFTGSLTADQIAKAAELLLKATAAAEQAEDSSKDDFKPRWLDKRIFLAYTNKAIRTKGWISRGKAYDTGREATADRAYYWMTGNRHTAEDEDYEAADKAIEWLDTTWRNLPDDKLNDYQHNLLTATENGHFPKQFIGIVASLIIVWKRETEVRPAGEWLGKEKQRIEVEGKIIFNKWLSSNQWGETFITKIQTASGVAVYFGSHVDNVGEEVACTATVKKLEEYRGEKQTVINRPRWK